MSIGYSTDYFQVGKGIPYFNQKVDGVYLGELDLGDAPSLSLNISTSEVDYYSSRGGYKAKVDSFISEITPTLSFELGTVNKENLALLTLAETEDVVQKNGAVTDETHVGAQGKKVKLDNRGIVQNITESHIVLTTDDPTVAAVAGDVITGSVSGATAVVIAWDGATDTYDVYKVTGTFQANETLTTDTGNAGEAGTINATAFFTTDSTATAQTLTVVGSTSGSLTKGVDFDIYTDVFDDKVGRIHIIEGGNVVDGETLTISYYKDYMKYKKLKGLSQTSMEGAFRYKGNTPKGISAEMEIWRVALKPDGDYNLISDEYATISFTGEILKDEVNHPDSPYWNILVEETDY